MSEAPVNLILPPVRGSIWNASITSSETSRQRRSKTGSQRNSLYQDETRPDHASRKEQLVTARYQPSSGAFLKQIEYLGWLPATSRSLLKHFVQDASGLTTCNAHGKALICQMFVPRALQSPALLHALLANAAVHKKSLTASSFERDKLGHAIKNLVKLSIQAFQIELDHLPSTQSRTTLAAIALFLCEQAIHGREADPDSWRTHMEGTKAILVSIHNEYVKGDDAELFEFSRRWYRAIESLAALSSQGLRTGPLRLPHLPPVLDCPEVNYLDEYIGYNRLLNDVLLQIGELASHRQRAWLQPDSVPHPLSDWTLQADLLEQTVHTMLYESQITEPVFYPDVISRLTPAEMAEFSLCNQAFHHMALIHLYCRVRRYPPYLDQVQWCVTQILDCTSAISPSSELSPYLALTGPVFTAGCVAFGPTRDQVRHILTGLFTKVQSQSMRRSLELLEAFWEENQDHYFEDWDSYAFRNNIDFIPF